MQITFSKRTLFESLILVVIIVAGVWYTMWRPPEKGPTLNCCVDCPVSECTVQALLSSVQEYPSAIVKVSSQEDSALYRIGDIVVDKNKAEISFPGSINQTNQSVQFFAFPQLPDVQIECLITAQVKLIDLQNAIALLAWSYWEQLRTSNDANFELWVQWGENNYTKQVKATEVVKEERSKLGDLIFLGTEFQWPEIALMQQNLPSTCPIVLPKEIQQRALCEINSSLLPPPGTKVTLILSALNLSGDTSNVGGLSSNHK